MERRLLTFIVASTAFFIAYASLRIMVAPPIVPADANQAAEAREEPSGDSAVEAEVADASESVTAEPDAPLPERPERPERLTLGSMSPQSDYMMLVTLNSRGGGIERIELTERKADGDLKYRRVDVFSGYLGYLAGESAEQVDGVLVNVVGPGTPAAIAGIQVGDIITRIDETPVAMHGDIDAALSQSRPGDPVSIDLVRSGQGSPTTLQATLTEHPLDLVRLAKDGGVDQIVGNESRLSCLLTLSEINQKSILTNERTIKGLSDPTELIWTVTSGREGDAQPVAFEVALSADEMKSVGGKPVGFRRSYTLVPGSYALGMSVQIDNLADVPQDLAYRLEGPNGITLEGWWYSNKISPNFRGGSAARDLISKVESGEHLFTSGYDLLSRFKDQEKSSISALFAREGNEAPKKMQYVAVDAQYFTVGYVPPAEVQFLDQFESAWPALAADPDAIQRHKERAVNTTFFLDSVVETIPPGGSLRQELQLFAGPKQPELLNNFGLGNSIYYGWFAPLARVLAGLLHMLSGVGNYAIAIILLTLIVRAMMFPLSRKAAVNAQKMQELAPEMKKITDKYQDDMEGKLKAQRELQQRVGFNPLAGCLPMFLQFPIFIGLYRALSVDIELRQAAVSKHTDWASNLAAPDMFKYWGDWLMDYLSGRGTGWLGPYFNILPVIVVVLFLAQQKMFMPPATDDQTRMTQKMMNVMTLMMGLFFFRVPAGLCIYFITSSLWGICERVLVKKTLPKGSHFDLSLADAGPTDTDGPKEEKSKSIADRIRDQMAKPPEPTVPPNKRKRPKQKKK